MSYENFFYENSHLIDSGDLKPSNRLGFIKSWLPPDISSLLDVGCGNGRIINHLSGLDTTGIDINIKALRNVKSNRCQSTVFDLPFANNVFDLVLATEVIEHIAHSKYEKALLEIARVSKKYILITVPYKEDLQANQIICSICKCQFNKYFHMRSFNEQDMHNLFVTTQGISLKKIRGVFKQKFIVFGSSFNFIKENFLHTQSYQEFIICPQCGLTREQNNIHAIKNDSEKSLSAIWPKSIKYKWWFTLYEKG